MRHAGGQPDADPERIGGSVTYLNLETGEVVKSHRAFNQLVHYGWRVVEGHEHLEWQPTEEGE